MAFTEVNGVKLWYETTGGGAPVVHIHGAGFGHFNFATATPIVSKFFRCIDFDMRGYGAVRQTYPAHTTWKCGRTMWPDSWIR